MTCRVISPGVIVCGGRARTKPCSVPHCAGRSVRLCDHPTPGGKSTTCSAPICGKHATSDGGLDFCPPHAGGRERDKAAGVCVLVAWAIDMGAR